MKPRNFPGRKDLRREMAKKREALRAKRSDKAQLAKLKATGHGHCKEADKLRARIAKTEAK